MIFKIMKIKRENVEIGDILIIGNRVLGGVIKKGKTFLHDHPYIILRYINDLDPQNRRYMIQDLDKIELIVRLVKEK